MDDEHRLQTAKSSTAAINIQTITILNITFSEKPIDLEGLLPMFCMARNHSLVQTAKSSTKCSITSSTGVLKGILDRLIQYIDHCSITSSTGVLEVSHDRPVMLELLGLIMRPMVCMGLNI